MTSAEDLRPEMRAFFARIEELDLSPRAADQDRPLEDYPRMPQGTCYPSSRLLTVCFPELSVVYGRLTFYVHSRSVTIDHAWCSRADGSVVDATWTAPVGATDVRYEANAIL